MLGTPSDLKQTYREMISVMDEGIGVIMDALERYNVSGNTLVFFLSDNGATKIGSNGMLRGFKSSLWEGGHRVPAIAYWGDRIEPGTCNELLLGMDIFPTIVSIIKGKSSFGQEMDGIDFSRLLFNREPIGERTAFWRFGGDSSIRRGSWKLIVEKDSCYLFNLSDDIMETNNLILQENLLADSLKVMLKEWEEEINAYKLNTY